MTLTIEQRAELKTELQTDPLGYGYMAAWNSTDPASVEGLINKVRDGTDGEAAITIRRADISPQELLEAIDVQDFITNANNLQASWFESVTQAPTIRLLNDAGQDTRMMANLARAVRNQFGSLDRVRALGVRSGSRAEQLFGTDAFVLFSEITEVLRS